MSKKLTKSDLAYNALLDVVKEESEILYPAIDRYNKAVKAIDLIYPSMPKQQKLIEIKQV